MTKRVLITLTGASLLLLGLFGGSAQAAFGIAGFSGAVTGPGGQPLYQAGAHPDFTTNIELSTTESGAGSRSTATSRTSM
jgi:hypothetical protein